MICALKFAIFWFAKADISPITSRAIAFAAHDASRRFFACTLIETSGVWPFFAMLPATRLRRDAAAEVARLRLALPRDLLHDDLGVRDLAHGARVRLRGLELDVAARRVRLAEIERGRRLERAGCRRARARSR